MKTDDLIKALQADGSKPVLPLRRAWVVAAVLATVIAAIVFFILLGPRPDIAAAAHTLRFLFKFALTLVLAGTAFAYLRALARPGANTAHIAPWLVIGPVLIGLAVVAELFAVPADQWATYWQGENSLLCMTYIPIIGLGPLAAFLAALRHGAPTRPRLAGAVAGLLAGALAATFYAAHCPDDSPLFVATWYSIAIAILMALGMGLGPRVARW